MGTSIARPYGYVGCGGCGSDFGFALLDVVVEY